MTSPPLPDSSTSSASFFAVPKCKKKNYTLKLSALGALTKIEAFLPKSNSDHQTGGRQGLNRRALCAATPIYRLPLRMTGRTSDLHFFLSSEELANIFPDVIHCTIMIFCAPCGDLLFKKKKKRRKEKNSTKVHDLGQSDARTDQCSTEGLWTDSCISLSCH